MTLALSVAIIFMAIAIVVLVLMQSGKSHGLSGTIAGGAETFFGKDKAKGTNKLLNKITTVAVIVFALVLIVLYLVQPDPESVQTPDLGFGNSQFHDEDVLTDTEAATSDTTPADSDTTPADSDSTASTDSDTSASTDSDTSAQ